MVSHHWVVCDRCHPSGLGSVRAADAGVVDVPQPLHGSARVSSMPAQRGLNVTPVVPATACHSRSDAERYRGLNPNTISALRLSRIKPVLVQLSLIDLQGR